MAQTAGITLPELTPAQESLFLTLGSRALDSRLARPFLGDTTAHEILAATRYDLRTFPQLTTRLLDTRSKVFDVAVRTRILDDMVRSFLVRQPNAVVLDLGAGLDSRMRRVNPQSGIDWYDIDFPEIASLRDQLMPPAAHAHHIGADLTDPDSLSEIPDDRPAAVVADGLVLFLQPDAWVSLVARLTAHFPSGELLMNAYTTRALRTFKRSRAMRAIAGDLADRGFDDPHELDRRVEGLTLAQEVFLTRAPEVADLSMSGRLISRLAAHHPSASRLLRTMVLRYRF